MLPIGGFYKARRSGEKHAWEAQTMHMLQSACDRASFDIWKQYSAAMRANPPIHIRDLLDIKPLGKPVPIEEVESITSIRKRFVTPGMSLGALGPEAHKTLNVAMNRIGAKSDSGEGGEDPAHFLPERTATTRVQDQAGGVGPVWRDGGIPERLRGVGGSRSPKARNPAKGGSCRA